MRLQKLRHDISYMSENYQRQKIITHGVNIMMRGGIFTICGLSIPDAVFDIKGWEAVGTEYEDSITKCNCQDCKRIIRYIKSLK